MRVRFVLLLALNCFIVASSAVAGDNRPTWYVSPGGNDAWSGRLESANADDTDGPLATLARAVEVSREAGIAPRRIVVLPGEHAVAKTIDLTDADAGLCFEGQGAERPLVHGGRALSDWHREGDKFWAVDVPKAKDGKWDFRVLVVNGRIAERSRLPETGHFEHLSRFNVTYMSAAGGHWQRKPTDEELTTMQYKPEDLGPWLDVNNAEVVVYHMWSESLVGVAENDVANHTLRFKTKAANPPGAFRVQKYVVYNLREGLKHPGQWYLDRTAGKVVYWPLPDEDMSKAHVFAPVVKTLFSANFKKDAPNCGPTFRHLKLSVTDIPATNASFGGLAYPGAVELAKAHGATLEDVEATALGGWFVKEHHSRDVAVRNCHIHHLGTSGVRLAQANGAIENNQIHHMGLLCNNAVGLYVSGGKEYRIRRNVVHDTPYCGMIVGGFGQDYRVEENLVYRAMQVLHDGAAFYCGQSVRLQLRRNIVRDTEAVGQGYGVSAYYLDEKSTDCLVEGNVSINVSRPTHNHMTVNCTLRNNVFIHESDMTLSFARSRGYTVEGNMFYTSGKLKVGDPEAVAKWSNNVVFQQQPATALAAATMSIGDKFTPIERKLRKTPRTMKATPLAAAPKVDGVLELGEWPDSSTGFVETPQQQAGRGAPAVFKACVHDGSLYLAVIVVTMDPEQTRTGSEWGKDDAVEVALGGTDADGKPITWVLRGFAGGKFLSETVGGASAEAAKALLEKVAYKSEVRKNDWRSEWVIPLKALGANLEPGKPLSFNITAWRTENGQFRQYAGSLGETWDLQYGGRLLLPTEK